MASHIQSIRKILKEQKTDAFLATDPVDVSYLSGCPVAEAWMLVTARQSYYLTDSRYVEEIKKHLGPSSAIRVQCVKQSLIDHLMALAHRLTIRKIVFDGRALSVAVGERLKQKAPQGVSFRPVDRWVVRCRAIKDLGEISQIKKALRLHQHVHQYIKRFIRPGISEQEIALKFEMFVRERGGRMSFDPIVASGPHSAYPHARPTRRRICSNDIVLLDAGVDLDGYKTDLTRMFFLGRIAAPIRRKHDYLLDVQQQVSQKIAPGVKVATIDQLARKLLEKENLEKYFTHGLGHGVGRDVHELPALSSKSPAVFQEGMVVTVEPAVYFPGRYGLRVEEMVYVTKKGSKVLSDHIH